MNRIEQLREHISNLEMLLEKCKPTDAVHICRDIRMAERECEAVDLFGGGVYCVVWGL